MAVVQSDYKERMDALSPRIRTWEAAVRAAFKQIEFRCNTCDSEDYEVLHPGASSGSPNDVRVNCNVCGRMHLFDPGRLSKFLASKS